MKFNKILFILLVIPSLRVTGDAVTELINNNGFIGERHTVKTKDGYILGVHHIKPKAEPKGIIFLMHGLVSSSADYLSIGKDHAIGFKMSEAGFDVWLGNARGNDYSRNHTYLKLTQPQYWDFSWHEIGVRDLPAMIDYVLKYTGQRSLYYVGHSQGTTAFFVMLSELPEYNQKIRTMFALAPVAYMSNIPSIQLRLVCKFLDELKLLINTVEYYDIYGFTQTVVKFAGEYCPMMKQICKSVIFSLFGNSKSEYSTVLVNRALKYAPSAASVFQFYHYGQLINSKKFRKFDHGPIKNRLLYGSKIPPVYKLSNIVAPIKMFMGTNDALTSLKDILILKDKLPNVMKGIVLHGWNHIDLLWSKNTVKRIVQPILDTIAGNQTIKSTVDGNEFESATVTTETILSTESNGDTDTALTTISNPVGNDTEYNTDQPI